MRILISSCLLGENVKYSGGNNYKKELIEILNKYKVELIAVCPEVIGGLSIPREPAEIKENLVFNRKNLDVTNEFINGAYKSLKIAKENNIDFAILKERSPSCGSSYIYDGNFSGKLIFGMGFTTKLLRENSFKVFSEENLEDIEKILQVKHKR